MYFGIVLWFPEKKERKKQKTKSGGNTITVAVTSWDLRREVHQVLTSTDIVTLLLIQVKHEYYSLNTWWREFILFKHYSLFLDID